MVTALNLGVTYIYCDCVVGIAIVCILNYIYADVSADVDCRLCWRCFCQCCIRVGRCTIVYCGVDVDIYAYTAFLCIYGCLLLRHCVPLRQFVYIVMFVIVLALVIMLASVVLFGSCAIFLC